MKMLSGISYDSYDVIGFIILVVVVLFVVCFSSGGKTPLIPYEILNQKENKFLDSLTLVVEVPPVGERLPSDEELEAIAIRLLGTPPPKRSWVFFYLPGTVPSDWEYATGHYLPEREGAVIVPFGHYRTNYEHTYEW